MVVPVEARTAVIFLSTASRAISIEMASAMATAKIAITPTERMVLRNAFLTPRLSALMGCPSFDHGQVGVEET